MYFMTVEFLEMIVLVQIQELTVKLIAYHQRN